MQMRYDKVIHSPWRECARQTVTKEERMLMKKITRRSFMAAMAALAAGGVRGMDAKNWKYVLWTIAYAIGLVLVEIGRAHV